jgi:hypothetical protein
MSIKEEFLIAIDQLTGLPLASFAADVEIDGDLRLEFGVSGGLHAWDARDRTVPRPEAAATLAVECAWRIDDRDGVRCGGFDVPGEDGPKLATLRTLTGVTVMKVAVAAIGLDLHLEFSNGLTLRVFCDQVNDIDNEPNYALRTVSGSWVVDTRSDLRRMVEAGSSWLP